MATTLDRQPDARGPGPAVGPGDSDVVLYDGHCRLCQAQMRQLRWWDRGGRLQFVPFQADEVRQRWPDLDFDRLQQEMCVVDRQGHRHWGAYAVRYLSRRLPTLWWLAPVLHLPGSMVLWRPVYRWIARNRYRMWGRTEECDDGTCRLHS